MAQHDYILENQPGAAFRGDLNAAMKAIVSQNSGATEPTTTYPYQFWADTASGILKQRNAINNAWISILDLGTGAVVNGVLNLASVPSIYRGDEITVTKPHLRKMVWDATQNKYIRAPWHAPGKLSFFLRNVPKGHIEVRSDVVLNTADFPDLAAYLGVTGATFVLDETRGEFLRALDSGRGVDTGRSPGTAQIDTFKNHTHGADRVITIGGAGIDASSYYGVNPVGNLVNEGGSETRPRNIAYRLAVQY